tara:strand:- start:104 stop:694 length:591 start_codon:yes stop_codon:yes gene_type:complete
MGKTIDLIRYKKALDFSYNFYKGKFRKGIKFPYFNYLSSVSNLIIENNGNTDEAISGLVHDYFEFESVSRKSNYIKNKFGVKVLNIIKQCSDYENPSDEKNVWLEKKKRYLESMSKKSQSTMLVVLCDKLHSVNCILNDHNRIGKKLWSNYFQSPEEVLWYYRSLCNNFKKSLKNHKTLKDKFQRNVNELQYRIKK